MVDFVVWQDNQVRRQGGRRPTWTDGAGVTWQAKDTSTPHLRNVVNLFLGEAEKELALRFAR